MTFCDYRSLANFRFCWKFTLVSNFIFGFFLSLPFIVTFSSPSVITLRVSGSSVSGHSSYHFPFFDVSLFILLDLFCLPCNCFRHVSFFLQFIFLPLIYVFLLHFNLSSPLCNYFRHVSFFIFPPFIFFPSLFVSPSFPSFLIFSVPL